MSFGSNLIKLRAEFKAGFKIYNLLKGIRPTYAASVLDELKINDSLFHQNLKSVSCSKSEIYCFTVPQIDVAVRKNIIELPKVPNFNLELPIRNSNNTALDFPYHIEREISEPKGRIISKKARHIIAIRRRKMRKHKFKKLMKKNKIDFAKRKLKRDMENEATLDQSLKNICSQIQTFSAEKYVNETLEKVHWQKPITKVKGFLAPKWVIKNYLEEEKEKQILKKRLEECMK